MASSVTRSEVRAKASGEYGRPRKGQWYLSGATVEAYQARTNMDHPYHLATLITGRMVWDDGAVQS